MCETKSEHGNEKILYFEICRIAAVFCIMYQHTGGRGIDAWMYTESHFVYITSLIGRIVSSIGVPLFWMVSGALLLPKTESFKKVYGKRIPRMAGVLVLFSIIRYFYLFMVESQNISLGEFFRRFYRQDLFLPYWFLYAYLGILLVLPFLRKMVQNLTEQEEKLLFVLLLGWHILNDISKVYLGYGFMINLNFQNSLSYFIFGYLLENCRMLRKSDRKGVGFCIGIAVFVTEGLYIWVRGQHELECWESLIMLLTISVYYLIRYIGEKPRWEGMTLRSIVLWCGSNVFGIYLIEDYLRNATAVIWERLAPHLTAIPSCCIWLGGVFLIGNILIAGARKLPLLRKIL